MPLGGSRAGTRSDVYLIGVALVVALVPRLLLFLTRIDVPGDGPTRAVAAYAWSRHPSVVTHGWWPPGFLYLAGPLIALVPRPLLMARLLNVTIGTLTVVPFFVLTRSLFGSPAAFLSAVVLACLPLHAELSATGLSEASFVFEIVSGVLCLVVGCRPRVRPAVLAAALILLAWAGMTRYEGWILIPFVAIYCLYVTRNRGLTLLVTASVTVFPIVWTLANYYYAGDALLGLTLARKGVEAQEGAHRLGLASASSLLAIKAHAELGAPLLILSLLGAGIAASSWRRLTPPTALYGLVTAAWWMAMLGLGMMRGATLYTRYLIVALVLTIPFGMYGVVRLARGDRRALLGLMVVVLGTLLAQRLIWGRTLYLRHGEPEEIKELAAWLKASPFAQSQILATDMGWEISYLPVYWPEGDARVHVVSMWLDERGLQAVLASRPSVLVTKDGDRAMQERVETHMGLRLDDDRLVGRIGAIKIYGLRGR
jgi:4-amino-4-deoxy-L-arabinose transferase-like glycosyltransferase